MALTFEPFVAFLGLGHEGQDDLVAPTIDEGAVATAVLIRGLRIEQPVGQAQLEDVGAPVREI